MSSSTLIILFSLLAAAATLAGGMAATLPGRLSHRRLSHIIAFGAGYILAAALVSLLPESLELVASAPLWVLAGYALAHLFEHTFTTHFHFGEETHAEHVVTTRVSTTALVGLSLHAFFDGVAISSGFLVTPALGVLIALAVVLHKVPEGVTISSLMLASGRTRKSAREAALLLAAATLLGAACMSLLGEGLKGIGLALSCGIALYVAATDLMPEINQHPEGRYSISAATGVLLYFGVHALMGRVGLH
ncbi:MAG TPA: ZIP family metal transporter [Candidatus Krumholzibacteria bacterium]|nr:ZIP family metal transporter [Candidatus Krumholzibacteria bacterium]